MKTYCTILIDDKMLSGFQFPATRKMSLEDKDGYELFIQRQGQRPGVTPARIKPVEVTELDWVVDKVTLPRDPLAVIEAYIQVQKALANEKYEETITETDLEDEDDELQAVRDFQCARIQLCQELLTEIDQLKKQDATL